MFRRTLIRGKLVLEDTSHETRPKINAGDATLLLGKQPVCATHAQPPSFPQLYAAIFYYWESMSSSSSSLFGTIN